VVEQVDRRILGAIRVLDAVTSSPVTQTLDVSGEGLTFQRNRSGLYVIVAARGLEHHLRAFSVPPATPDAETLNFSVLVHDPSHVYLPVILDLALPRAFDPSTDVRDLQQAIDVPLASSVTRIAPPGWSMVNALVRDTADEPVRGALIEVEPAAGGNRLAWGLTNHHGEALVPVPGLPALAAVENDPLDPDDNEIITAQTNVTVRAIADPSLPWPVRPAVLTSGAAALRTDSLSPVALTPGRTNSASLRLNLG